MGGAFFGKVGSFEEGYEFDVVVLDDSVSGKTWLNQTASVLTFGEIETNIVYKVKEGDCLFSIAREILGDQFLWERIYEANKDLIKSPDKVYVGQELIVPLR